MIFKCPMFDFHPVFGRYTDIVGKLFSGYEVLEMIGFGCTEQ